VKAYLYVEGAKLRLVSYQAHEVWAMHMGHTFRARRLHFGSGASVFPSMAPDYVVPIEADSVAVYVSTAIVDKGGPLPEEHRTAIAEQLKALEGRSR
jgi:mono/diheme cytochrome c family protein